VSSSWMDKATLPMNSFSSSEPFGSMVRLMQILVSTIRISEVIGE
jgi:hypothetical protein